MVDESKSGKGMGTSLTSQTLVSAWEQFLNDYCKSLVEEAALDYPETKSVVIDWAHIDLRDPTLAEYLLDHPRAALEAAAQAVRTVEVPVDPRPKLHVRVKNLPRVNHMLVRKLRAEHLGKFVAIEGLVKKTVEVRPKLEDASFRCELCCTVFRITQDDQLIREPDVCPEEQGGCGRKGVFKLLTDESKFIDFQKIEVQESHEDLRGGAQPERISIYLEDDLVGEISPGDRIIINGILRAQQRRNGSQKLVEFQKVLDCVSVEVQQHEFEEIEILPEDLVQIQSIAAGPDVYKTLRDSFAPELFGMEAVKDSLIMTLFGGLAKELRDGTRLRGDIHILLVGDPGVAKSQILRYLSKLAPRAIYTSGKGSSAAGLTAAAVRDEFGEGQWSLEAGALVLADKGLACIDELDKMDPQDQSAMHQAMEQQEISIAKAGITATLKSRCAVIGAANPKLGRFDEFTSIIQQINMPPPLLSRFDLIFSLRDKPKKDEDATLANHILTTHRGGEVAEYRRADPDGLYTEADEVNLRRHVVPAVDSKLLRKYVAYAKRAIQPVMTEEAVATIKQFYVDLRSSSTTIPFTPRALESMVRLTEASARARLSKSATDEDANRAIRIFRDALRGVSFNEETGTLDIDIIAAGVSHSQQDRMKKILEIIRRNTDESKPPEQRYPDTATIIREATAAGVPQNKVEESLASLKERGTIYSPRFDRYAAP